MDIKFNISGESADIGVFNAGDILQVPDDIARTLISRKIAEEIKIGIKPEKRETEVKDNG